MKVALMLVEGFEIVEAMAPLDLLKRVGVEVELISVFDKKLVSSSCGIEVKTDKNLSELNHKEYEMLIVPGGTVNYGDSERLITTIKEFYNNGKYISSICASPFIFAKLGLLKGKNAISFPSFRQFLIEGEAILVDEPVVIDGKVITGRSMAGAIDFGLELVRALKGDDVFEKLKAEIVY